MFSSFVVLSKINELRLSIRAKRKEFFKSFFCVFCVAYLAVVWKSVTPKIIIWIVFLLTIRSPNFKKSFRVGSYCVCLK